MDTTTKEKLAPHSEIEKKYLINGNGQTMTQLIKRMFELFPDAEMIDARHEDAYFLGDMTPAEMHRYRALGRIAEELALDPQDESTVLSIRTKHQNRRYPGHDRLVAIKSDLHGTARAEYPELMISSHEEEAIHDTVPIETQWYAHRVELKTPEDTLVYIQELSGYGYTLEIEAASEKKVDSLAGKLNLVPMSKNLLNAMYSHYKDVFMHEGGLTRDDADWWLPRHFTERDWATIAAKAGEEPVFNKL